MQPMPAPIEKKAWVKALRIVAGYSPSAVAIATQTCACRNW
jgi:hypothetical protein